MHYNNVVYNEPLDICNAFSRFFHHVYEPNTLNLDKWIPPDIRTDRDSIIHNIQFKETCVEKELKAMDPSKGAGPDGIPSLFLVRTADNLYKPLHIIFNRCISEGVP